MTGLLPRTLAIVGVLAGCVTIAVAQQPAPQPAQPADPALQPEPRDAVPPAPETDPRQDPLDREQLDRDQLDRDRIQRQPDRFQQDPLYRDEQQPGIAPDDQLDPRARRDGMPPGAIGVSLDDTGIGDVYATRVHQGSAAERAGLMPGDRILAVDGRRYASAQAVANAIRREPGRAVDLLIQRAGIPQPTTVRIQTQDWEQAFAGQPRMLDPRMQQMDPRMQFDPRMQQQMPPGIAGQRMMMRPGIGNGQQIQQLQSDIDALHQELQVMRRQLSLLREELQTLRGDEQRPARPPVDALPRDPAEVLPRDDEPPPRDPAEPPPVRPEPTEPDENDNDEDENDNDEKDNGEDDA